MKKKMTKRFKHSEFQQDDGQYQYYGIEDTEKNFVYNVIGDGMYDVSEELLINLLNELEEEKEELESFKKLVYLVLKKEYDLRMNEMNIFAEKEDWQGYRATKLERGIVQRIAKRLGVDLE